MLKKWLSFSVRDSAARLPNGEGTRGDICELLKDSQFLAPGVTDAQVRRFYCCSALVVAQISLGFGGKGERRGEAKGKGLVLFWVLHLVQIHLQDFIITYYVLDVLHCILPKVQ